MASEAEFIEAAKNGDATRIRSLLKVDSGLVHASADHRKTALHWAAERDHAEVAAALVDAGADIEARTSWGASPFDWAATMGSSTVADLLLARGCHWLNSDHCRESGEAVLPAEVYCRCARLGSGVGPT